MQIIKLEFHNIQEFTNITSQILNQLTFVIKTGYQDLKLHPVSFLQVTMTTMIASSLTELIMLACSANPEVTITVSDLIGLWSLLNQSHTSI